MKCTLNLMSVQQSLVLHVRRRTAAMAMVFRDGYAHEVLKQVFSVKAKANLKGCISYGASTRFPDTSPANTLGVSYEDIHTMHACVCVCVSV